MKKLTLLLSALMITGAVFAHGGKNCCKSKKECKKEAKAGKKSCCEKKSTETAKK